MIHLYFNILSRSGGTTTGQFPSDMNEICFKSSLYRETCRLKTEIFFNYI